MAKQYLRMTFYGREAPLHAEIGKTDAEVVVGGVKSLPAGGKYLRAFYLFPCGGDLSLLLSVRELQTLQLTAKPNGDWTVPALRHGVAFYLKGRRDPLELGYTGHGPLDDMFHGLAAMDYHDEIPGCIMLADGAGEPAFFRMDEIQYALARNELIRRLS